MRLAQQLYEGVDIKGNGTVGIITYLRTDSTRVSEEAENMARSYITEKYGEQYAGEGTVKRADRKFRMPTKRSVRRMLHGPLWKSKNP